MGPARFGRGVIIIGEYPLTASKQYNTRCEDTERIPEEDKGNRGDRNV